VTGLAKEVVVKSENATTLKLGNLSFGWEAVDAA
jgi:hypothetical protein